MAKTTIKPHVPRQAVGRAQELPVNIDFGDRCLTDVVGTATRFNEHVEFATSRLVAAVMGNDVSDTYQDAENMLRALAVLNTFSGVVFYLRDERGRQTRVAVHGEDGIAELLDMAPKTVYKWFQSLDCTIDRLKWARTIDEVVAESKLISELERTLRACPQPKKSRSKKDNKSLFGKYVQLGSTSIQVAVRQIGSGDQYLVAEDLLRALLILRRLFCAFQDARAGSHQKKAMIIGEDGVAELLNLSPQRVYDLVRSVGSDVDELRFSRSIDDLLQHNTLLPDLLDRIGKYFDKFLVSDLEMLLTEIQDASSFSSVG